ncbi:MAG: hypothetical protein FWH26_09520 [Oscillospiraceae bacterium]|nr:hypothetical protein [Oscillospiraceae bacterium]
MKILYLVSKILSYPGAFLKGFWEHLSCQLLKIRVLRPGYLRGGEYCGHVEHEAAGSAKRAFLLAWLPHMAQWLLAAVFLLASAVPLLLFGLRGVRETRFFWLEMLFLYLGLSCLCNAFPTYSEAQHLYAFFCKDNENTDLASGPKASKESTDSANGPKALKLFAWALRSGAWLERYGIPVFFWYGLAAILFFVR